MKYTPGPWSVGTKQGDTIIADKKHARHDRETGHDAIDYYGGVCVAESVLPENRELIAAAPEMLEALKAVNSSAEWDYLEGNVQEAVAAAITKAEGV